VLRSRKPSVKNSHSHGFETHKLTWDESVKRDLKEWNISKDLAMDRSTWSLAINVPEP
jgi:hypothetical protein